MDRPSDASRLSFIRISLAPRCKLVRRQSREVVCANFPRPAARRRTRLDSSLTESGGSMNEIKLAVLGTEGVGKSALVVRFLTKRFIGEYASSSECIYKKRLSVDGRQINLEIFDPCSQNLGSKSSLTDQVNWADGFVVVYDIGDRSSFVSAKSLLRQLQEVHSEIYKRDVMSVIFLVGNKQDLCHVREVSEEEGLLLAGEHKCHFCELSAAEDHQEVGTMFSKAIRNASGNRRRRPSGSKSMAKLINNVFGKRRKSV